jgi:hypothetical protein
MSVYGALRQGRLEVVQAILDDGSMADYRTSGKRGLTYPRTELVGKESGPSCSGQRGPDSFSGSISTRTVG